MENDPLTRGTRSHWTTPGITTELVQTATGWELGVCGNLAIPAGPFELEFLHYAT